LAIENTQKDHFLDFLKRIATKKRKEYHLNGFKKYIFGFEDFVN
jgi:hypothetical protein